MLVAGNLKNQLGQELKVAEKKYEELQAEAEKVQPPGGMKKITKSTTTWMSQEVRIKGSGQIIATSHDLTPNGGLVWEIPLFQGNLGW